MFMFLVTIFIPRDFPIKNILLFAIAENVADVLTYFSKFLLFLHFICRCLCASLQILLSRAKMKAKYGRSMTVRNVDVGMERSGVMKSLVR